MLTARQGKEVVLRLANEVGAVAKLSKLVAEKGVNILAMSCWGEGSEGVVNLVTDDNLRTVDVLRDHGYAPREEDVVLIDAQHKPGMLLHISATLAQENIDIQHLHASATINQDVCLVVLRSSNNERAFVLLNE